MFEIGFVLVVETDLAGFDVEVEAAFVDCCVGCYWDYAGCDREIYMLGFVRFG